MNNEMTVDAFALSLVPEEALSPLRLSAEKPTWASHVFASTDIELE